MNGDSDAVASESPVLHLTHQSISASVCLPDIKRGYYRGTRFDWSGVLCDLRVGNHCYITDWQPDHDPVQHDGLTGPVDEFTQIGYERVRPGEVFLKIGVGMLRKPSDAPYDRFQRYEIVNPGIRDVIAGHDRIEFRHLLQNDNFGYDYTKTLLLTDAPGVRIEYSLRNLGTETLTGHVYNHNFFTLDGMATGTDTSIILPFPPEGTWREAYDCVALTPAGIAFNRSLNPGESVFMGDLRSRRPESQRYEFCLRNLRTGAGIRAMGSNELSHIVFWACPTVACLEPYTPFRILPGKTGVWHIDYELLG